jgi:formyltetrahydrofolate synthetase
MSFPSVLDIATGAVLKPLGEIADAAGIPQDCLEPYGVGAAKIKLEAIERMADRPRAKYVVVSAITPTPLGEGKTTTAVGLGQAFQYIGSSATIAIRQPSMGPTFGIKGGAAGGGYSQVVPMELFNLHLTGDMHAVTAAHNLCSALLDAHLYHGNDLGFDPHNITWRRVLDVNDRSLRNTVIGMGGANRRKQLENMQLHGCTPVVAINVFPGDHQADIDAIHEIAAEFGARAAISTHFSDGGKGATELASAIKEAAEEPSEFKVLYPDEASLKDKIHAVATKVYGADGVEYSAQANKQLQTYTDAGFDNLPVCIAKSHLSLSHDPNLKGAPTGWTLPVREVRASVGAGFIYPICGDMRTMPGLGKTPAAHTIDIDADGNVINLS